MVLDNVKIPYDEYANNNQVIQSAGLYVAQSVTRPNTAAAYTAGDVIGSSTTGVMELDFGCAPGIHFIIINASLRIDYSSVVAGMGQYRLHLFTEAPTAQADDAALNLKAADKDKYLGYLTFDTPIDLGDFSYSLKENLSIKRKLMNGTAKIYGMLTTQATFTATGMENVVYTVKLHCVQA